MEHMNKKEVFRYKHYLRVVKRLKENKILPLFNFEKYRGVKNHYNLKCKMCGFEFISTFDNGYTPKCPKCLPNRITLNYGHLKNVDIKCEYCNKLFNIICKNRNHRFCSVLCKNEFIKKSKRENVKCLNCGKLFERYKNILHPLTKKPTQYCSNECSLKSDEKKQKLIKWGLSNKNHWNNPECQKKVRETKLKLYGDAYYNNVDKMVDTNMKKYGVPYIFYLPKYKSNGKRISNFQRKIYVDVLKLFPDAKLEEYLRDVQKSVDIFIPFENKVIECHGDYWHCNPISFKSDYYNKLVHLTAQEIWDKDSQKQEILKKAGYNVEVVWENTNKTFKHSTK